MSFNKEKFIKNFNTPYKNVRKTSLLKSISAIFASLFTTYFGVTILAKFVFETPSEAIIISLLLNTLIWPCLAIWIFLSSSPKVVFLRAFVPSLIVGILFIFLVV